MITVGIIMAAVGYAYMYWRFCSWLRRRERMQEIKLEMARREHQARIVEKYGVRGYDLDRKEFGAVA